MGTRSAGRWILYDEVDRDLLAMAPDSEAEWSPKRKLKRKGLPDTKVAEEKPLGGIKHWSRGNIKNEEVKLEM